MTPPRRAKARRLHWPWELALGVGVVGGALSCSTAESSSSTPVAQEPCTTEGATEPCYPGAPATQNLGECVSGTRSCSSGSWSGCANFRLPTAESCDGRDEDCNGLLDDGCPCELADARPCYGGPPATSGMGECHVGVQSCVAGVWASECEGEVLPVVESCDGGDNDCNGVADDGCACLDGEIRACYSGPSGTDGVGSCHGVTVTCEAGAWPAACPGEVTPATESCNGGDDDCDHQTDEDNPGGGSSCATGLAGPCAQGVMTCSGGALSCVSQAPTTDPACQPCAGCLAGHSSCTEACQYEMARPGGDCTEPASTDPGHCCNCYPELDCSQCLNGFPTCPAACQASGYPTGFCAIDGSTDIYHCCFCFTS